MDNLEEIKEGDILEVTCPSGLMNLTEVVRTRIKKPKAEEKLREPFMSLGK